MPLQLRVKSHYNQYFYSSSSISISSSSSSSSSSQNSYNSPCPAVVKFPLDFPGSRFDSNQH